MPSCPWRFLTLDVLSAGHQNILFQRFFWLKNRSTVVICRPQKRRIDGEL